MPASCFVPVGSYSQRMIINVSFVHEMERTKIRSIKEKGYALNSETRIEILFLCQEKELTITQIGKKLNLSLNNTSQNVSILERAGLVKKTKNKDGTVTVKPLAKIVDRGIQW